PRTYPASAPTIATPITASCRCSCESTSATDTLKRSRRRSLTLCTTCRLSLRLRASRINNRTRSEPTNMRFSRRPRGGAFVSAPPRGRRLNESLVQRPLHLLDAVRLDDVADLDVVIASDLHAALEPLAHLAHVLLEALQRLQAGGLVRRRVDDHA